MSRPEQTSSPINAPERDQGWWSVLGPRNWRVLSLVLALGPAGHGRRRRASSASGTVLRTVERVLPSS